MEQKRIIVCTFMLMLNTATALDCLQCSTSTDENSGSATCDDPFPVGSPDNVGGCSDTATHCVKLITLARMIDTQRKSFLKSAYQKSKIISRMCIRNPDGGNGCHGNLGNGGYMIRCYCDTDNCNGSSRQSLHLLALVISLILCIRQFTVFS